jgi:hypothetical protein
MSVLCYQFQREKRLFESQHIIANFIWLSGLLLSLVIKKNVDIDLVEKPLQI